MEVNAKNIFQSLSEVKMRFQQSEFIKPNGYLPKKLNGQYGSAASKTMFQCSNEHLTCFKADLKNCEPVL